MEQKRSKKRILVAVISWILIGIGLLFAGIGFAESLVDHSARVLPKYAKEDLTPVLAKEEWSSEDIDFLYHQTGLSETALLSLRRSEIPLFQESFFHDGQVLHELTAFTSPHDYLDYTAKMAPLEDGDVLVTSSCHTFGWRNGHAAIVVNAKMETVIESNTPGVESTYGAAKWFCRSSNFLLLRLKDVSREDRAAIARYAEDHLLSVPYSLTVGIFTKKDLKDNVTQTHCSHLVWQAYRGMGYDIDSDGGMVCTSKDIANYKGFEVVQVYGFDPDKLWK